MSPLWSLMKPFNLLSEWLITSNNPFRCSPQSDKTSKSMMRWWEWEWEWEWEREQREGEWHSNYCLRERQWGPWDFVTPSRDCLDFHFSVFGIWDFVKMLSCHNIQPLTWKWGPNKTTQFVRRQYVGEFHPKRSSHERTHINGYMTVD